jgi:hypothetical protein
MEKFFLLTARSFQSLDIATRSRISPAKAASRITGIKADIFFALGRCSPRATFHCFAKDPFAEGRQGLFPAHRRAEKKSSRSCPVFVT